MPSARTLWVWLALTSMAVVAVGASVLLESAGENTLVAVVVSAVAPIAVVAVVGPWFRILPLLGIGSVAYASWFWLEAGDTEVAPGDWLAMFGLWQVVAAWVVAALLSAAAVRDWLRRSRRRAGRRHGRG